MARVEFITPEPRSGGVFGKAGFNLGPQSDYNLGCIYRNLIYASRDQWVKNDWTSFDGSYSDDGWPLDVGTATSFIQTVIMTQQRISEMPTGLLRLSWVGGNGVRPNMAWSSSTIASSDTSTNPQYSTYDVTAWGGTVTYNILKADIDASPGGAAAYALDPIRDVELCPDADAGTTRYGGANLLEPAFLAAAAEWDYVRFLNISVANQKAGMTSHTPSVGVGQTKSNNYATMCHGPYNGGGARHRSGGATLGICIEIANQCGIKGWFHIPGEYTDQAVTDWAQELVDNYDHSMGPPIIENSNEIWNGGFSINAYTHSAGLAEEVATESSPGAGDGRHGGDSYPAWRQSGFRSHQMMNLVEAVFDAAGKDFSPVLCLQTGYTGRNKNTYECNSSEPFDSGSADMVGDFFPTFGTTNYWGAFLTSNAGWLTGGEASLNTVKGGPGNVTPGQDQSPDFTEAYASCLYSINTYETNGALSDTWQTNANQIFAHWPEKSMVAYEANHHATDYGGNDNTPEIYEWVSQYETEEFAFLLRRADQVWTSIFTTAGGKVPSLCFFVLVDQPAVANRGTVNGHWQMADSFAACVAPPDGTYKILDAHKFAVGQHSGYELNF